MQFAVSLMGAFATMIYVSIDSRTRNEKYTQKHLMIYLSIDSETRNENYTQEYRMIYQSII